MFPPDNVQAMAIWRAVDRDDQLNIFQNQLRSAKDPTKLMHEMAKFCAEAYSQNKEALTIVPLPHDEVKKIVNIAPPQAALTLKALKVARQRRTTIHKESPLKPHTTNIPPQCTCTARPFQSKDLLENIPQKVAPPKASPEKPSTAMGPSTLPLKKPSPSVSVKVANKSMDLKAL
jgi:hypothetical protein